MAHWCRISSPLGTVRCSGMLTVFACWDAGYHANTKIEGSFAHHNGVSYQHKNTSLYQNTGHYTTPACTCLCFPLWNTYNFLSDTNISALSHASNLFVVPQTSTLYVSTLMPYGAYMQGVGSIMMRQLFTLERMFYSIPSQSMRQGLWGWDGPRV